MGIPPEVLAAIIGAVGSGVGGALAPNPFQPRESFQGTDMDPIKMLSGISSRLMGTWDALNARTSESTPTLPNVEANPPGANLPRFSGGGLPMPIGVAQGASGPQRLKLGGGTGTGTTATAGPVDWRRGPSEGDPEPLIPGAGDSPGDPGGNGPRNPTASAFDFGTGTDNAAGLSPAQGAAQLLLHLAQTGGGSGNRQRFA